MRPEMTRWLRIVLILALGQFLQPGFARSDDELRLRNGGRLNGQWINRERRSKQPFQFLTRTGNRITVESKNVIKAIRHSKQSCDYLRRAPTYENTAKDQWALAEWCHENKLPDQARHHWRQVVHLNPEHAQARIALGYRQIHGQWMTVKEYRESQGYQRYRSRWRTPQEIELIKRRDQQRQNELVWFLRMRRWRPELDSPRALEARRKILAIRDPDAITAIKQYYQKETSVQVRMLFIEVLAAIDSANARALLVDATLYDPSELVFATALEKIVKSHPPRVVRQYTNALGNPNNVRVNRAAIALGKLADRSAIPRLIDALVTRHAFVLWDGRDPDAVTPTFSRTVDANGNGVAGVPYQTNGIVAGSKRVTVHQSIKNHEVLHALIKITGANLGYDQQAWTQWLAATKRNKRNVNSRRD